MAVGGNGSGYTYPETRYCLNKIPSSLTDGWTFYTRWTESTATRGFGGLQPLGVGDIEYYADGTHTIRVTEKPYSN